MASAPAGLQIDYSFTVVIGLNHRLYSSSSSGRASRLSGDYQITVAGTVYDLYWLAWDDWARATSFIPYARFAISNTETLVSIRSALISQNLSLYFWALNTLYESKWSDSTLVQQGSSWNNVRRPNGLVGSTMRVLIATEDQKADVEAYIRGWPDPVRSSSVTARAAPASAVVSWDAAADATHYEIERSTDGATWGDRQSEIGTSYTYTGLAAGQQYFFRVRAVNAMGQSAWTDGQVSVAATAPPVVEPPVVEPPAPPDLSPVSTARAHKAKFEFVAESEDITARVISGQYRHGAAINNNRRGWSLLKGRGSLRLENNDGYFDEARLALLKTISVNVDDTADVVVARVAGWRFISERAQVDLELEADVDYDRVRRFDPITMARNEAQILSGAGMTIANQTAWEGWVTDIGSEWCGSQFDFARLFATHANGIVFETGQGHWGIILPQTDKRIGGPLIEFSTHNILLRGLSGNRARGWRRDAQTYRVRDYVEHLQGAKDFNGSSEWWVLRGHRDISVSRRAQQLIVVWNTSSILDDRLYPSNTVGPRWGLLIPGASQLRFRDARRRNGSEYQWDGEFYVPGDSREKAEMRITKVSGASLTDADAQNLQVSHRTVRLALYLTFANDFADVTRQAGSASAARTDSLPQMPWAAGANSAAKYDAKLAWWKAVEPRIVRLNFDTIQNSEMAWQQVLALDLGDACRLNLEAPELTERLYARPLMREWNYNAERGSHLTVDFIAFTEIPQ